MEEIEQAKIRINRKSTEVTIYTGRYESFASHPTGFTTFNQPSTKRSIIKNDDNVSHGKYEISNYIQVEILRFAGGYKGKLYAFA